MTLDTVLERLATNIFREPYASDGKVNGVFQPARKMAKSAALLKPVLQINGPRQITYLSFDLDYRLSGVAWDDNNLPPPNLVVTNPCNGHAHLIYELEKPIWLRRKDDTRHGEAAPVRYLKAVYKAIRRALKADSGYNGLMVKNPFHKSWWTVSLRDRPYQLSELSAHLELDDSADCDLRDNTEGRNCTLFDSIRYWAYRHVNDYNDRESFRLSVTGELDRLNHTLTSPLGFREVAGIAKSVFEWVWTKYTGSGKCKNRGVMGLDPSEDLRIRQQKGQEYSSAIKRDSTVVKIRSAISSLVLQGKRVSKLAVALLSKVSRSTVYRYWDICFPVASMTPGTEKVAVETVPLRGESMSLPSVGAASPSQRDTLIPTELYTPGVLHNQPSDPATLEKIRVARAMVEASLKRNLARRQQQTSEPVEFQAIDNVMIQRNIDGQPTTQ